MNKRTEVELELRAVRREQTIHGHDWDVADVLPAVMTMLSTAWKEGRVSMWSEGIDPHGIHMPPGDNPYEVVE